MKVARGKSRKFSIASMVSPNSNHLACVFPSLNFLVCSVVYNRDNFFNHSLFFFFFLFEAVILR